MRKTTILLWFLIGNITMLSGMPQPPIPEQGTSYHSTDSTQKQPMGDLLSSSIFLPSNTTFPSLAGYSLHTPLLSPSTHTIPVSPIHPRIILPDGTTRLSNRTTVFGRGEEIRYPGFGGLVSIEGGMEWQLHPRLTLRTSVFTLNQFAPYSNFPINRNGSAISLHYQAGDHLELDAWGRMMLPEGTVAPGFHNPHFFPQTGVGGAATLKLGESFRIGVSAEYYQLNPNINDRRHQSGRDIRTGF